MIFGSLYYRILLVHSVIQFLLITLILKFEIIFMIEVDYLLFEF